MKLRTKRFDPDLPLPAYEDDAAGFDFVCRQDVTIEPGEMQAIPGNIALEIPTGYVLLIVPRSSTPHKYGLMMPNSIGVIDPFYHGDENEIMLLFYNYTKKAVQVKKGDQIAQGILVRYEQVEFDEVKSLPQSKRSVWKVE